ncbi:hypothetical protein [Streptomyces sp. NPDC054887]
MPSIHWGLHISTVRLGASHRVCAVWRVSGPADPRHPCEFPGALLLSRRGAEQDWAVETTLAALDAQPLGDGPACATLTTTAQGIELVSLRPGLCAVELRQLSRTALGEDHDGWARLSREDPAAFHASAASPYVARRQAAVLLTREPDGRRGHRRVVHERQAEVLRDYTAALVATAEAKKTTDPP